MKYQIVKFTLNIDNSKMSFVKIYDGEYDSKDDAENALSYIIDGELENDDETQFEGRIPLYEITNLPTILQSPNTESECYWYASGYLCEGAMNFVKEYSSNHNIPIESI